MVNNINEISLDVPCKLRNLTKLNAPSTATEVPKFPFTKIITALINTGIITKVLQKFFEYAPVFMYVKDIINPNIIDDQLDLNTQIFEYNENGFSNNVYVEKYIMTKLNAIKDFVIANNLFDLLTYRIEKLDKYDNYLFIIEPITFEDCKKWTKIFSITYSILIVVAIVACKILI